MSADDLLYEPIGESVGSAKVDFHVRENQHGTFDWKPRSGRAHSWCARHFPASYDRAMEADGWIKSMADLPGPMPSDRQGYDRAFNVELIDDNYLFEEVVGE